jgi:hypothetical protein
MQRVVVAFLSITALLLLPAVAASADTVTEHNGTDTMHDSLPCVAPATITITYNEVDHVSVGANGSAHGTSTTTGTFVAVLDAGGTSTGRFTVWDGFNSIPGGSNGTFATFTLTFSGTVLTGPGAGTSWNEVQHLTAPLDDEGNPILDLAKVAFDNFRCH